MFSKVAHNIDLISVKIPELSMVIKAEDTDIHTSAPSTVGWRKAKLPKNVNLQNRPCGESHFEPFHAINRIACNGNFQAVSIVGW